MLYCLKPLIPAECDRLVPIPDKVPNLPDPFLSPVSIFPPLVLGSRAFGKPAFAWLFHTLSIRPCLAWCPGSERVSEIVHLSVCTLLKGNKEFCGTVTGSTVLFNQPLISPLTVIVDLSKQGQTLARSPDHMVVEFINHLFVIVMSISTVIFVPPMSMQRFMGFIVA